MTSSSTETRISPPTRKTRDNPPSTKPGAVHGSSKAALDQLTNVLAAEHPGLRIYALDPGDMRTDMHAQAFPGEDISDRPEPETVLPALARLIEGDLPSSRYRAAALLPQATA